MKKWFFHDIEECDSSKKFWDWSVEKDLVFIGWAFLAIVLAGYLFLLIFCRNMFGQVTCFWRIVFHVYCPVCGGSRAALSLVRGHIIESLKYNPVVFTGAVICIPFLVSNTLCYMTKGKVKGMRFHGIYMIIIIAVMVIDCVWKNYMLLAKGIALIP